MPLLKVQTNATLDAQKSQALLKDASQRVAQALNKPEQYMMVSIESGLPLLFAGTSEPTAFVELKGIGLPTARTGELSRLLCAWIESELGVPQRRIYINFADVPAGLWGWNGATF
jgi:phenylpyruvate tautomerase PptA (4-oxalocrotonate tautomerase family)